MLSMGAMSGDQAGYYLSLAREDYYLEGGEPPGRWYGNGAADLGLVGTVEADHLYNLFRGSSPDGSIALVQMQRHEGRQEHRPGWDLTFSAPKSVSVLWSQCSEANRARIQAAHFEAVKAAIDYLQDSAAFSRHGRGGHVFETSRLIVACFEHSTSRALDPQLHTHALVMNIGVGSDGRTRTISSLNLFLAKMAAGAIYRAELSRLLTRDLGIEVERRRSWFEVVGVPQDLIEEFSKRRGEIEEELKRRGLNSAEAAAVAAIQTREAKGLVARKALFDNWREGGEGQHWTTVQADRLFDVARPVVDIESELRTATELVVAKLTSEFAHFTKRDMIRFLAEECQGRGVGAKDIQAETERYLRGSPEIVRLGTSYGQERFTTQKMFELESALLSDCEGLASNTRHQVSADTLVPLLSRHGELSQEQMRAFWHITHETGAVSVVSGMPGTGKTVLLKAAAEAWKSQGYRVMGAGVAAKTAGRLEASSGIESTSIAMLLHRLESGRDSIDEQTIVVIDEAGMVATPELARLARHCKEAGAKLVLIGDERQIQPIGPGAPFPEIGERFGQVTLVEIQRQNEAWARKAVKDLADGKSREVLREFASRGLVTVAETKSEAMESLVSSWKADGYGPRDCLILAGTRAEVAKLNALAQAERLGSGELGAGSVEHGSQTLHEGDRVIFSKNSAPRGINNGDFGTLTNIDAGERRVTVKLDSGERVTFCLADYGHVSLGYAYTTHKGQGATALGVYVLAGGAMQDRELSYVQASRAREVTRIFTTQVEAGDAVAQLAVEMERSRRKTMAHAIRRHVEPDSRMDLDDR